MTTRRTEVPDDGEWHDVGDGPATFFVWKSGVLFCPSGSEIPPSDEHGQAVAPVPHGRPGIYIYNGGESVWVKANKRCAAVIIKHK